MTLESEEAGERRYRYLETVRQYARERLVHTGAIDRLRRRHFECFHNAFRGATQILRSRDQLTMLRRLRIECDNVRGALEWGLESPALSAEVLELAGSLFWYWTKLGLFHEGRQWLERALALPVSRQPLLRARALIGLAHMDYFQGKFDATALRAEEALALTRDGRPLGPWVRVVHVGPQRV